MSNCCNGIEKTFSQEYVSSEAQRFRRRGPARTTHMLIDVLKQRDLQGLTLLDIGGGLGAIQHDLLSCGVSRATDVDASQAYIAAARQEAQRRGLDRQVEYIHADFVEIADRIPEADIVTLDRVICCYDDMDNLVRLSAARARRFYGLVYPRSTWWTSLGIKLENLFYQITGNPYRAFVHPTQAVERLVRQAGLTPHSYRKTPFWQVVVYAR